MNNKGNGRRARRRAALSKRVLTAAVIAAAPGAGRAVAQVGLLPQATTIGIAGDGIPDFVYDPLTGDVVFKKDGVSINGVNRISGLQIQSASGAMIPGASHFNGATDQNTATSISGANFTTSGYSDNFDIGSIMPTGLGASQLTADLTVRYQVFGQGVLRAGTLLIASSVPVDTSLHWTNGIDDESFETAGNWGGGAVPGSTNIVSFGPAANTAPGGAINVRLSADHVTASLISRTANVNVFLNGHTWTLSGTGTTAGTMFVGQNAGEAAGLHLVGPGTLTTQTQPGGVVLASAPSSSANVLIDAGATWNVQCPLVVGNGGAATLTNYGNLNSTGVVTIGSTGTSTLDMEGGTLGGTTITVGPAGTFRLAGGVVNLSGALTNHGQFIYAGGGTLNATLVNQGTVSFAGTGTFAFPAGFDNQQTLAVGAGATFDAGAAGFTNNATVQLSGGNVATSGRLVNAGQITGYGTLGGPATTAGAAPPAAPAAPSAVINTGTITASAGVLTINGPLTNAAGGVIAAPAGGTVLFATGLAVNAGSIGLSGGTVNNNGFPLRNDGQISGYGSLLASGLSGSGTTTLGGSGTALAALGSVAQRGVTLHAGGTLALAAAPAAHATNTIASLVIDPGGKLDLANQDLLTQTSANTIRAMIARAYDGGDWRGSGLTSSLAVASPSQYAVGYADGSDPSNPRHDVPAGSVLVRPSLVGDANLDGQVDFGDITQLLGTGKYATGAAAQWTDGDFNYDGLADFRDIVALLGSGNFGGPVSAAQQRVLADLAAGQDGFLSADLASVPEPAAGAGVLAMSAAAAILSRRRRRRPNV